MTCYQYFKFLIEDCMYTPVRRLGTAYRLSSCYMLCKLFSVPSLCRNIECVWKIVGIHVCTSMAGVVAMDENGFSDLGKCPSSELRKLHILRLWDGDSQIDTSTQLSRVVTPPSTWFCKYSCQSSSHSVHRNVDSVKQCTGRFFCLDPWTAHET